ncbi:MAG: hypothetical protein JXR22_13010 [Prolixibacteraceae bacterium]|nr:hypothetical protein [Prolixibacteraceae bacterium]
MLSNLRFQVMGVEMVFTLPALANILEGPRESFFGSYTANDRVECKVVYQF